MSEHTPGFGTIELHRAQQQLNLARSVLAYAQRQHTYHATLLQLLYKYSARASDRQKQQSTIQSCINQTDIALDKYNTALYDYLGAKTRAHLGHGEKITAAEDAAYEYIKMSRFKQILFNIKSRFK